MVRMNILSGFLGSGKTTAILEILKQRSAQEKIALLVNEFGELDIDGATLQKGNAVHQVNLPSGCICCQLAGSLSDALKEIHDSQHPERLLIEPTGIAVPLDIVRIARSSGLGEVYEIMALTAVADPRMVLKMGKMKFPVYWEQLHQSTQIVLNKCDLATPEELDQARALLGSELLEYELAETQYGRFPLEWLDRPFSAASASALKNDKPDSSGESPGSRASHATGEHFSLTLPAGPLDKGRTHKFFEFLAQGLYGFEPWRAKALIELEEGPVLFNLSGTGEVDLASANPVMDGASGFKNRFVVIAEKIPEEAKSALEADLGKARVVRAG